jgi:hypothetical protein
MKPPKKEQALYRTEIELFAQGRSPAEMFRLASLLEDAINPLAVWVTGGTLDMSTSRPDDPLEVVRAAFIFKGTLTSNQIIMFPNRTQWWWVQNATTGPYTLTIKTPSGPPPTAIRQNAAWQLIQCDGNDNIVPSQPHIPQMGSSAREWMGSNRQQAQAEICRVACVPADQIGEELGLQISLAVESALFDQRIRKLKRRKEMRVPFRRISYLRSQLIKALDELDDEVFRASGVDRVSVVGLLSVLLNVPLRYLATSRPKNRVSNRPRGSTKNPILRDLILDLHYAIVDRARGKLTLYGGGGQIRGTLPAVLEILRPYLPEVIPMKLPYETLRDIRKSAREAHLLWPKALLGPYKTGAGE